MEKEKNLGGRPKRDFDPNVLEGLCHLQCTKDEIEHFFKTDHRVIDRWCHREYQESFDSIYKKLSSGGKTSLRRNQFNLSKKSASMAIFLGKNWLGQKDHQEITNVNSPYQDAIDLKHENMMLRAKLARMEENANKSEAG